MFLAEKSNAILFRKYPRGRDFFDWMSLIEWGAQVDLKFMRKREVKVKNKAEYQDKIIKRTKKLDFLKLTKQLSPFLFRLEDQDIMKHFPDHVEQIIKKL